MLKQRLKEATETGRAKILELENEAEKLVRKVVEKGREAQEEGRRRLELLKEPLVERVRDADLVKRVRHLREEVEDRLEGGMEKLLEAFGIASQEELGKLGKKVDALAGQVRELAKAARARAKREKRK